MENDLTKGKPLAVIVKFMIPLCIGNIFQQLYNMADSVIVGRFVGQNALAAVGSTGTIMFLVMGFATGLTSGFTVLTSQRYGAGDECGLKISVANATLLSLVVAALVTVVSVSFMHPVLRFMNTPDEIYQDAYSYITIVCGGAVAMIAYNLLSSFLRAVGNSKMPLVSLVFSASVNVALDLILIIFFHMGVAGAALATVISQGLSAILCLIYILRKVPVLVPERRYWRFHPDATGPQLRVGLPMALQFAITASGTMVMQTAINLYGATAVAAITAGGKVQNILTQAHLAMGQSIASYVGQNYGKGDYNRIRKGVNGALIALSIYSVVAAVLTLLLLRPVMSLFFPAGTDLTDMMPYANTYIRLCVVNFIPLGMIFIFRNAMQGCGYGLMPMLGGVVELICRMSMAFASMATMNFLLAAACDPFAWLGAGIFTAFAYTFVMKKVKATLGGN